ncbi:hypothetical protein MKW94_015697 [Papaver nudicaule]|uniref:COX assembly mitochondrial protein n=1 Tax=Papaver nudicaule TaxID=74823 RepID=A0AA41RYF5_PAPNU|nr:hypothetical protein [Papaver nudicaule]
MCQEIIEEFQKCHTDHPYAKFFDECTDWKIKFDQCFRLQYFSFFGTETCERKENLEERKRSKERLQAPEKKP